MDIKEILRRLVSYNTIHDKQNKEIMDFIENYLKKYGFTTKRISKCLIAYNKEQPKIEIGRASCRERVSHIV